MNYKNKHEKDILIESLLNLIRSDTFQLTRDDQDRLTRMIDDLGRTIDEVYEQRQEKSCG